MENDVPNFEFIDSQPSLQTEINLLVDELGHRRRHAEQFKDAFHLGQVVAYSICLHYLGQASWRELRISHGTLKHLHKVWEKEAEEGWE